MNHKKSMAVRMALLCLGEALLVWGILAGARHETAAVNRAVNEVSELRDPSPFRAALLGHLGKIHLGLEGYLRSPSPLMEKQVAESRQDFEKLVPEFTRQNAKLFPQTAAEEIQRSFGLYKEAIDRTLDANARRMERRGDLEQNFGRILYILDHSLRPLIRKAQADGEERSESVLNIENQLRAWQQNLAKAWTDPSEAAKARVFESDNRGETFLELYARMELLPRERKMLHEIRTLWQTNSDVARETFATESIVAQAQKAMEGEREQVVATLNKFLPALPPAQMEAKKQSLIAAMRLHMTTAGALGFLGIASVVTVILIMYRILLTPPPAPDGVYRAPSPSAASDMTVQMDLKGMITAWSATAETLYGYSAAEMRGQSIGKLFESESEIARLGQELQKAKQTTFETVHKTKAGDAVRIRIEFRPVADTAGHATAISLLCTTR